MTGLEPVLLGSAATGSAAATAGLFGAGGAFAIGQTLTTIGALAGAAGAMQSGRAEAQANTYNAAQSRMEAAAEEARRRREGSRAIGAIRAGISKSGVTTEGTPMMVLAESAAEAELDALNARWQGEASSRLYEMRASSARKAIPYAVGASLLTGAGKLGF
jgi:hypothetical protein